MNDGEDDGGRINETPQERRDRIGFEGLRERILPSLQPFLASLTDEEYDMVRGLFDSPRGRVLIDEGGDYCDRLGYPEDWTRGQCLACELLGGDPTETSEEQLHALVRVMFGYCSEEAHWSHQAMKVVYGEVPRRRTIRETLSKEA